MQSLDQQTIGAWKTYLSARVQLVFYILLFYKDTKLYNE